MRNNFKYDNMYAEIVASNLSRLGGTQNFNIEGNRKVKFENNVCSVRMGENNQIILKFKNGKYLYN